MDAKNSKCIKYFSCLLLLIKFLFVQIVSCQLVKVRCTFINKKGLISEIRRTFSSKYVVHWIKTHAPLFYCYIISLWLNMLLIFNDTLIHVFLKWYLSHNDIDDNLRNNYVTAIENIMLTKWFVQIVWTRKISIYYRK